MNLKKKKLEDFDVLKQKCERSKEGEHLLQYINKEIAVIPEFGPLEN